MASISKQGERFRVQIRTKNVQLSASFSDLHTAELWARYKENMIQEMEDFSVPNQELICLKDAIEMKISEMEKNYKKLTSISDLLGCLSCFNEFLDKPISYLTYNILLDKCKEMSKTIVTKGGCPNSEKGSKRIQSPMTILKKMRCLSSVFGTMIEKGFLKTNPVLEVLQHLKYNLYRE